MREEGSEGRIKRMTCWCREVCKIDRGRIYLSPDGSVLGVHLWRNEISGRLSGRGRLCCPAAYTLTQHPACSVCSHTTCSAFNLPDRSVYTSVCVCVRLRAQKQRFTNRAPVPRCLAIKRLGQCLPLGSASLALWLLPSWELESPRRTSH